MPPAPPKSSSMPHPLRRGLQYSLGAMLLTQALMLIKGALAWAATTHLYTVPWVGGLLQSLEVVEISNVLVFALLGWGLGAMTCWMARPWGPWRRLLVLVLSVPMVFISSYAVRHHLWLQAVAIESNIPMDQAAVVTDLLLDEATNHEGVVGYFYYTVQVPLPPTELSALQRRDNDDQWFRSELTRQSGLEPGLFTLMFYLAGWGIRLFYMGLAAITAAIYFTKGSAWAASRRPRPGPSPRGTTAPRRPHYPSP